MQIEKLEQDFNLNLIGYFLLRCCCCYFRFNGTHQLQVLHCNSFQFLFGEKRSNSNKNGEQQKVIKQLICMRITALSHTHTLFYRHAHIASAAISNKNHFIYLNLFLMKFLLLLLEFFPLLISLSVCHTTMKAVFCIWSSDRVFHTAVAAECCIYGGHH